MAENVLLTITIIAFVVGVILSIFKYGYDRGYAEGKGHSITKYIRS